MSEDKIYSARMSFGVGRFVANEYVALVKNYLFYRPEISFDIHLDKGWPDCYVYLTVEGASADCKKVLDDLTRYLSTYSRANGDTEQW